MGPCPYRGAGMPRPQRGALSPQFGSLPIQRAWKARCFTRASTLRRRSAQTVRKLDEMKHLKQYLFLERMHLFGSCKKPDPLYLAFIFAQRSKKHSGIMLLQVGAGTWWCRETLPTLHHCIYFSFDSPGGQGRWSCSSVQHMVKHICGVRSSSERHGHTGVRPEDGYKWGA